MDDRCLHRRCRAAAAADADPGVDTMLPPGEGVQHPHRIGLVLWLAEHLSLTLDHRIKAADDVIGRSSAQRGLGGGKRLASWAGESAAIFVSSSSLVITVYSGVIRDISSRRRGLPEARIRAMVCFLSGTL